MNRTILCVWLVVLAMSTCVLVIAGTRAAAARSQAHAARRELVHVSHQATELARLRQTTRDFPDRPEGGLAGKVAAAMSRAGLSSSTLQTLSPEAQSAVTGDGGARLVRQRATLTLSGPSLPQIGGFLEAWRIAEPNWVVSNIDLSQIVATTGHAPAALGTDVPLRAVISIEGLFKSPGASR